jgi:hypothetical protein
MSGSQKTRATSWLQLGLDWALNAAFREGILAFIISEPHEKFHHDGISVFNDGG